MMLALALAACTQVTVLGGQDTGIDPGDSSPGLDPCLDRGDVRADVYVDASGSLTAALTAAPDGRIFLTAGDYGDVVLGPGNDGLALIGSCREEVRLGVVTRIGGGALSLAHVSLDSLTAQEGSLVANDTSITTLTTGGEVQFDDGALGGWVLSGGVGLLSRSEMTGVLTVPSGVQLAMVEDTLTDVTLTLGGTMLARDGSLRGGAVASSGTFGADSWSVSDATLAVTDGYAEFSGLMMNTSTLAISGGTVSGRSTVGIATTLVVTGGAYVGSGSSLGSDSVLRVDAGVVTESGLTADLATVELSGGKLTISGGDFSRASRAITVDGGTLVMTSTTVAADEWSILVNGGVTTLNNVSAEAPVFISGGVVASRDLQASSVTVDGGQLSLTTGTLGGEGGSVALKVSGGAVTLDGGTVTGTGDMVMLATGGNIDAEGLTVVGGQATVGVGAGGSVRCENCSIVGRATGESDTVNIENVEIGGVVGDGAIEATPRSAVGVVVDGGSVVLIGGEVSGHDALGLWMGSGSARLVGVAVRGGVDGGFWAAGGNLAVQAGTLSGARGIVATSGAEVSVAGTVSDCEVGVLLDGTTATLDGTRWLRNGVDVWQQNCGGVEAPTGLSTASSSICLATVALPVVGWTVP